MRLRRGLRPEAVEPLLGLARRRENKRVGGTGHILPRTRKGIGRLQRARTGPGENNVRPLQARRQEGER